MVLCLRCWRLWPRHTASGETVFCGTCHQPLGLSRLCAKSGHRNPLQAQACLICADRPLSGYAPCLELTWIVRALAVLATGAVLRAVWLHLCCVAHLAAWSALSALSFVFATTPRSLAMELSHLLTWLIALYLLSWLLPAQAGGTVRTSLVAALRFSWRATTTFTLWLWHTAVVGPATTAPKRRRSK